MYQVSTAMKSAITIKCNNTDWSGAAQTKMLLVSSGVPQHTEFLLKLSQACYISSPCSFLNTKCTKVHFSSFQMKNYFFFFLLSLIIIWFQAVLATFTDSVISLMQF